MLREEQQQALQPVHQVYDGIFNTFTGKTINIYDPKPEMFCIEDICKGLSNICRFGGQIREHYSVAQHTLLVWFLAPDHLKKAALVHDMPEAYIGDVIKPLKVMLESNYGVIERRFEEVIFGKFGVSFSDVDAVKPYDMKALEIEHAYFHKDDTRFKVIFNNLVYRLGKYSPEFQLLFLCLKVFPEWGHYRDSEEPKTASSLISAGFEKGHNRDNEGRVA